MNEVIETILSHSLTGVVLGFCLGILATTYRSVQEKLRIRKLIFKELAINWEQTNFAFPPDATSDEKMIIKLLPDLIADVGESLQTTIYEGNVDKLSLLKKAAMEKVVDAYRTIYQFKRFSKQLRSFHQKNNSRSDKDNFGYQQLSKAVPPSATIAYRVIKEALELMSKREANNLFQTNENKRGMLIHSIEKAKKSEKQKPTTQ